MRAYATGPPTIQSRIDLPVQLIAEDLVIGRGGREVVAGLTFVVQGGSALLLTGPNGAGKTTLLRALAGFIRPLSGSVRLEDGEEERSLAEQSHIVSHANAVKSSLTVAENVSFWAEFLGDGAETVTRASVLVALRHFGLDELADFPAAYLSAGQRRRVGLARLLAVHRPVWLLDEPSVSLDAQSTERLQAAINTHTSRGGIAVVATHLPLGLNRSLELPLGRPRVAA